MTLYDRGQINASDYNEGTFCSFNNLSPIEYYGFVTDTVNPNNLEDISRKLELIELPDGVLVAVAGSDGKLEQHAQSKTEFIVIQEDAELEGDVILRDFFGKRSYARLFDAGPNGMIDTKNLSEGTPFSHAFSNADTIYPDRTLNMFPLHPISESSLDLYFRARKRVLEEMYSNKYVKKKLRDQLRSYKRSMKTGEFRNIPIFDTNHNMQYYSEMWPAYSTGFKTAFLRTVQRKLDLLTIDVVQSKDVDEVAREIPTTTIGRLSYVSQAGIISPTVASSTGEAYSWFLQQYHLIQESYKQNAEPTALPYDPVLFDRYSKDIEKFSSL